MPWKAVIWKRSSHQTCAELAAGAVVVDTGAVQCPIRRIFINYFNKRTPPDDPEVKQGVTFSRKAGEN